MIWSKTIQSNVRERNIAKYLISYGNDVWFEHFYSFYKYLNISPKNEILF